MHSAPKFEEMLEKTSPIDAVALKHWKAYSAARDAMLLRTHTAIAPWHIVRTDNKRLARLNLIRDILSRLPSAGKKAPTSAPDATAAEGAADVAPPGKAGPSTTPAAATA